MTAPTIDPVDVRRTRERRRSLRKKKQKIAKEVCEMASAIWQERHKDRWRRKQRRAKVRMWTENRGSSPWPDSSDVGLPDMTISSLNAQDALHNAVMSARPAVVSKPLSKGAKDQAAGIDALIDAQVFVDQDGEGEIGAMAQEFVDEGCFTAFIPWVREMREVTDIRIIDPIPIDIDPEVYFLKVLQDEFPSGEQRDEGEGDLAGWNWTVFKEERKIDVKFYTKPDTGKVEMIIKEDVKIFDGPKVIIPEYDDVLCPARSANLQQPGPQNPNGAPHVILIERPTADDVMRLVKKKVYDLATVKDVKAAMSSGHTTDFDDAQEQTDAFQGKEHEVKPPTERESQGRLTVLRCFDRRDMDGDGLDEDVVLWVLYETKTLLKSKPMSEMYPSRDGRRPFGEATFLPVRNRREGMGLPELEETIHDLKKQLWDQMVDAGTLTNIPWGFYRPMSSIKPEVITLFPGDLYPLTDPKNDVNIPNLGNRTQAFSVNALGLADALSEKLTVFSNELRSGRVPKGKATALRNLGSFQAIQDAGEARPERILRRFFMGLAQVWSLIHEMNRSFLPEGKKFQLVGYKQPHEDPYREVTAGALRSDFKFDWTANVQNASRGAQQDQMARVMAMVFGEIQVMFGIATPDKMFNVLVDALQAEGVDPERYLSPPSPGAFGPQIMAEEAIITIINEQQPIGKPMESIEDHMKKLQDFRQGDNFGVLSANAAQLFNQYLQEVAQALQREKQLAAAGQAASRLGQGAGAGGANGQGTTEVDTTQTPVNEGELIDGALEG